MRFATSVLALSVINGVALPPLAAQQPGSAPADSSCVVAFDSLQVVFRRDYAGYHDKVRGHEAALTALTDSVRAIARASDLYSVCIPALQRWTKFFSDPHITGPWQAAPPGPAAAGAPTPSAAPPPHRGDGPDRPLLSFADESTVVLRLPTFDVDYKPAIDSLVGANLGTLHRMPYLIVDVRGNGGGCTCSYDTIAPLLYTNPIHLNGADILASAANTNWLRSWYQAHDVEFSESEKAWNRAVISRMETHPGEFVVFFPDTVLRRDTVYAVPRRVAILVDGGCASSCEDFVLEARKSRKGTVIGVEPTAGVHDYGNARKAWLPGWRQVRFPTSRARGKRFDLLGLEPAVRVSSRQADAVAFARRYLRSVS